MHRRVILEESDETLPNYGASINERTPQEYEMPTRGQSFVDGMKDSVYKNILGGLVLILIVLFILWRC